MKQFLVVMVYCLPVLGQAAYSGRGLYTGSSTYGAYSSSSCAAPNFCAYNGADLIPAPVVPNFNSDATGLANNGATAYDTSYLGHTNFDGSIFSNSSYLSPVTRVTDAYSDAGSGNALNNFAAGFGGSGVYTATNTDTTLVGLEDTAKERVCVFSTTGPNKGHCLAAADYPGPQKPASGIFITTNMNTAGGGSPAMPMDFGSPSFSLIDATPGYSTLYSFGSNTTGITTPTTVCPYVISKTTGMFTLGTCIVDFKYGLPTYSAPNWASSTSYSYGAYVIHALTGAEMWNGTGTWAAGVTVNTGDIISSGGSTPCMYRATTGGTTAGTPPAFKTSSPCTTDIVKESTTGGDVVVWRGTDSSPQFLYQNTTSGTHTSGSSFAISGHPDFFSTVVDASITWTNVGPAYVPTTGAQLWLAMGGVSRDITYGGNPSKYGAAISTNTYGLTPKYSYTGGQGTGIWGVFYDATLNVFHLLNTGTGIWTDYPCTSGNGFTCTVGTPVVVGTVLALSNPNASGQHGTSSIAPGQACPSFLHNLKISGNGLYAEIVFNPELYSACNSLQNFTVWTTTSSAFDPSNSLQYHYGGLTHWAIGTNKVAGFHGDTFTGGADSGVFLSIYNVASANTAPVFGTWLKPLASQSTPQTTPAGCYASVGSTTKSPDCAISDGFDSHMSWVGDPGTDTYPICGTLYNAAPISPAWSAWQDMEACLPTSPTYCDAGVESCPQGSSTATNQSVNPPWQFTHTWGTRTSTSFNTQFQISEYSQDANWLFFTGDMGCMNGSSTGSPPAVWSSGTYYQTLVVAAVPANPTSLCGQAWNPGKAYVVGNLINPIEGLNGSSQVNDVFQALTSGTTGPQSNLGSHQPSCLVYVGGTLKQASCFASTNPPTVAPITITGASESGTTGTISVSSPGLTLNAGVSVTLAGFTGSDTGWNGTFAVAGTVGTNCPGSACGAVTTFQLSGMPSGLAIPSYYSGTTATAQGDTVCDLTSPGQDSINASSCAGVTWGDIGPQNQRGDVFAVNLGIQQ